jgi:hypothetical protein
MGRGMKIKLLRGSSLATAYRRPKCAARDLTPTASERAFLHARLGVGWLANYKLPSQTFDCMVTHLSSRGVYLAKLLIIL